MTKNSINNTGSELTVSNILLSGNSISTISTNSDLILSPNGTGNISVTNKGIVPTTDRINNLGSTTNSWNNLYTNSISFDDGVNLLSSYRASGTWTPVLSFGGSSTGITYTSQTGYYNKINNLVFFTFYINLSSKGTATGNARISIPFPASVSDNNSLFIIGTTYTDITLSKNLLIDMINLSSNTARIIGNTLIGSILITDVNCTNTSAFFGSAFYYV